MVSPIEGIAGLGFHLTRQPDGTLQVSKLELEPRARRTATLIWTVVWMALGLFFTAGLYGRLPGNPEVTVAPGAREGLPLFFAVTSLSSLYYLVWTRLGREEWGVGRNRLEVRQTLLGLRRCRRHADTVVTLRRYYGELWLLEVGTRPQRLFMAELPAERLTALFDLAELLARETGWTLLAPDRPSGTGPCFAPALAPPRVETLAALSVDQGHSSQLSPYLEPGERLLWTSRPDAQRVGWQILPILYLGVPWTLFFLRAGHPWSLDSPFHSHFPGLFVVAGLVMCSSPLASYLTALRTVYAITDRRVLIATEGWGRKFEAYRPVDLCETERQELTDGSGDVLFARRQEKDSEGGTRTVDVKFVGIPQVREVERLLRQLFPREVG